ncbi:hypothetical protein [Haloplanus pelagicus]|jgi:hypothetical protein|uniref:hypothetical protein n=1 Tax=Haloplanus pelagicus TaxID=2949995 RepID=UPI002040489E|nr:hypothetical protein [Haloplanus sp. HW8-1]
MPSTSFGSRVMNWATSQRNLTIFVSIFAAFPLSYAFESIVSGSASAGSFLLLVTLAVGVPTAYDEYWPQYDQTWKAIGWILTACVVVTIEFIGLYIVGTEYLDLTPLYASAGAFLVTDLGNLVWLSLRQRT